MLLVKKTVTFLTVLARSDALVTFSALMAARDVRMKFAMMELARKKIQNSQASFILVMRS